MQEPQMMLGALIKSYSQRRKESIPRKYSGFHHALHREEIRGQRPEMGPDNIFDIDAVSDTEVARFIA
jgi:hypothetical protein